MCELSRRGILEGKGFRRKGLDHMSGSGAWDRRYSFPPRSHKEPESGGVAGVSAGELPSVDEQLLVKEPTKEGVEATDSELSRLQSRLRSAPELYCSNTSG